MNIIEQHELMKKMDTLEENTLETIQYTKRNYDHFVLHFGDKEYPGFYMIAFENGIISAEELNENIMTGDFSKYICIHLNGDTMDFKEIIITLKEKLHNQLFLKRLKKYNNAVVEEFTNGKIRSYKLKK